MIARPKPRVTPCRKSYANDIARSLTAINATAKKVRNGRLRSFLYATKDDLINDLIIRNAGSQLLDVHYQRSGDRIFVLISVNSKPRRTFHMPIENLTPAAEQAVIYQIGFPEFR